MATASGAICSMVRSPRLPSRGAVTANEGFSRPLRRFVDHTHPAAAHLAHDLKFAQSMGDRPDQVRRTRRARRSDGLADVNGG